MTATTIQARLLTAAVDNANDQLAAAKTVDINDHTAVIRSQEALAVALRRVLWALDDTNEPDVAAQVAAEDGYRSIGIPIQRTAVAA